MGERAWSAAGEGVAEVIRVDRGYMVSVTFGIVNRWAVSTGIVRATNEVMWHFERFGGGKRIHLEDGENIIWSHGRLTAAGNCARYFELLKELGLTFGQVEAELRELTGYKDPTS